jgi:hypothetical protein
VVGTIKGEEGEEEYEEESILEVEGWRREVGSMYSPLFREYGCWFW